jgi:hypothetical protein
MLQKLTAVGGCSEREKVLYGWDPVSDLQYLETGTTIAFGCEKQLLVFDLNKRTAFLQLLCVNSADKKVFTNCIKNILKVSFLVSTAL